MTIETAFDTACACWLLLGGPVGRQTAGQRVHRSPACSAPRDSQAQLALVNTTQAALALPSHAVRGPAAGRFPHFTTWAEGAP
jgi:hypothetical protein